MSFLRRRESSSSQGQASGSFVATAGDLDRWGAILEFVSAGQWPDGTPRTPGSLILFVEEGRLKCCLSDKDGGLVAFVTGQELLELLSRVEEQLREGTGDWRPSRATQRGKK